LTDTLILSDLHLGSDVCHAREAIRMLQTQSFRRLILLGDIFSDLNFRRLKKEHWQFLGYIRKLSNPKRGIEVVWVEGNHDAGLTNVMSHLVGVRVYEEYVWYYDGKKHLAVHGHQFDRFIVNNLLLSHVGTALHLVLQKLDLKGKPHTVLHAVATPARSHTAFDCAHRLSVGVARLEPGVDQLAPDQR